MFTRALQKCNVPSDIKGESKEEEALNNKPGQILKQRSPNTFHNKESM